MGGHDGRDDKFLDQRLGSIEGNLDDIRIALWQISEKLDFLTPAPVSREKDSRSSTSQSEKPVPSVIPEPRQELPPQVAAPALTPEKPTAGSTWPVPALGGSPGTKKTNARHSRSSKSQPQTPNSQPQTPKPQFQLPKILFSSKFWFNIIGVALVLLGVIFLYKYSVDQGWINSEMKVAFGMAIGGILMALGLYLQERQRFFSQMMVGAGIATFYISGYAAFQVYELIPFAAAVAWMSAVTLAAFTLAVQQNGQALALVATIGGLVTPFLMHQGVSSKADMVFYACAVLAGAIAVYFRKGWRPLLWVAVAGGWMTLLFIYALDLPHYRGLTQHDKWGLQAGVIFAVVAFWAVPVLRELFSALNPAKWSNPQVISDKEKYAEFESAVNRHVHALSISTPFIALFFTRAIWHLANKDWGWVSLGAAALLGLAFLALYSRKELRLLAYTQALVDLALFTMALGLILDGDARFIAITAEATAMQFAAWRLKDRLMLFVAHGYYVFLGLWLLEKLTQESVKGTAILNAQALSEMLLIIAVAAVSFLLERRGPRHAYQLASYGALLALFLRELADLTNGQGYVTISWGICAVALLAAGIIRDEYNWRLVALITLFVVVGKLILVDLVTVKAIWRVLLFTGFGSLFLVLSYFFQSLWKPPARSGDELPGGNKSLGQNIGGQTNPDGA